MRKIISVAAIAFILGGCGGGSGGGAGAGGAPSGPSTPAALGTATLPGATPAMSRTAGAVSAGATITVRATCGDPGIASVAMLIGDDWETATPVTVVTAGAGTWDATVVLPSPLPAACAIMARVTFADGNVAVTSRSAFTF